MLINSLQEKGKKGKKSKKSSAEGKNTIKSKKREEAGDHVGDEDKGQIVKSGHAAPTVEDTTDE